MSAFTMEEAAAEIGTRVRRMMKISGVTSILVGTVIWATGFRTDHSWIDVPVFDDQRRLTHRRGVTDSPGLYFLGLTWQYTRGSALIGFVADDAEHITDQINAFEPVAERRRERIAEPA